MHFLVLLHSFIASRIVIPITPATAARPVNAILTISTKALGILVTWVNITVKHIVIYVIAIIGTKYSHTLPILFTPPIRIKAVNTAMIKPVITEYIDMSFPNNVKSSDDFPNTFAAACNSVNLN